MYLKHIKLAGFKSFVDPTVIPIKGKMSAIVGPNGCGKSNVVDAIRWVIGESSSKKLRGQSMSDVIFNGTTSRKPVGKASVELLFENTAGRIVGEYAKYTEIAIRREVERDGQSSYYLNGTQCRRRDIIDIFLGTGLGPRSYSIIEQGMISVLIEGKPEDMRAHFEEASGISKYKERRRETETRIRHTQENLDRITDLCDELAKQLRHLKRQANAAERYKVYRAEERLLSARIKALHWQAYELDLKKQDERIQQQDLLREEQITLQRRLEADIEKSREQQIELTETQNAVQKRYYSLGADIARLEQNIQNTQEKTTRWQEELTETESLWQELTESSEARFDQIGELEQEVAGLNAKTSSIQSVAETAQSHLAQAESDMERWQTEWESFQEASSEATSQAEVMRTKVEHYQQQLLSLQQQRTRLNEQLSQLDVGTLESEIGPLSDKRDQLNQQIEGLKTELQTYSDKITSQRQLNQGVNEKLKQHQRELQASEGRYASLEALQQSALSPDDKNLNQWLSDRELDRRGRLGQSLQVESGWELAIETVLSAYFDAVCVDQIGDFVTGLAALPAGALTLVEPAKINSSTGDKGQPLATKVKGDWPFQQWLTGVYIADSVEAAERMRPSLSPEESVITRDGLWLGRHWVRVAKPADAKNSILYREEQLKKLKQAIATQQGQVEEQKLALDKGEALLNDLETERDTKHQLYQTLTTDFARTQSELTAKQTRLQDIQQRQQRLQTSVSECGEKLGTVEAALVESTARAEVLDQTREASAEQRSALLTTRDQYRDVLQQRRADAQHKQQEADELGIRLASNESQLALLKETVERDKRQLVQLTERRETLTSHLADSDTPLLALKEELQAQLDKRLSIESELRAAESRVEQQQRELKQFERELEGVRGKLDNFQGYLEELRMQRQTAAVRQATIKEQLEEADVVLETVLAELPEDAELKALEEELEGLLQRIQRLGPINLAAIEEHQTATERKEYLDSQHADLVEALTILETAIRKIDRETKDKFKATFDQANAHFQRIFPEVFGGGKAYLELEENDLLTAGVVVHAQPPGKRNTTIHMLSGGEKALTAISLVFSLFQLNPAPFCILDEVDAPLDDLNVGRFCQLVRKMADETQFLMISHNKVSIEMADFLMGVTMQEPGVSRIVSVDMDAAVELVEA